MFHPKSYRSGFLVQLFATAPTLRSLMEKSNLTLIEFFKSIVYERSTITLAPNLHMKFLKFSMRIPCLGYNCDCLVMVLMFILVLKFLLLFVVWVLVQRDGELAA
jgi:hypothetical protein